MMPFREREGSNFSDSSYEEISLRDIFDVILKRSKIILVTLLLVLTGVLIYNTFSKPVYEADALVKLSITKTYVTVVPEISPAPAYIYDPIATEIKIIKSRTILSRVIARYGLNIKFPRGVIVDSTFSTENPPPGVYTVKMTDEKNFSVFSSTGREIGSGVVGKYFRADFMGFRLLKIPDKWRPEFTIKVKDPYHMAKNFSSKMKVKQFGNTNLAVIKFQTHGADTSAQLANAVAEEYVNYTLYLGKEDALKTKEFIEEQLKKVEAELKKSEDELKKFKQETGIFLLDETAKNLITNISALEAEKSDVETEIASLKIQLANLRQQASSGRGEFGKYKRIASLPELSSNPYIQELKSRLTELEIQRAKLLEEYTESHPDVVQVERQIEATREQLREAIGKIVKEGPSVSDPIFQKIVGGIIESQSKISALEGKLRALERLIEEEDAKLKSLPGHEVRLAELQRRVDAGRAVYSMLLSKLEEARIAAAKQTSDAKVIDPAYPPGSPVKPRKRLNVILGLILGLMMGVGMAFVVEYMDTSVRSPEEVERILGVPVIGAIPEIGGRDIREKLVTHYDPLSPTAEAFKGIRTNIRFSGVSGDVRVILVTSSGPGEGKSTVASNLAITMAQMGNRVVLVDGDLRRPMVHRIFGLEKEPGLTEVIMGDVGLGEVIVSSEEVGGLDIVVCGHIPPNPTEVLGSERARVVIEELRGMYDYVVIDSAPLMPVTDAIEISAYSDGVILVVRHNVTNINSLKKAIYMLERVQAKVLGIIFNSMVISVFTLGSKYREYQNYYYYQDGRGKRGILKWLKSRINHPS